LTQNILTYLADNSEFLAVESDGKPTITRVLLKSQD